MKEILTEKELKVISKYLPAQKKRGRPSKDRIQMLRGIVYVLKTSTQWSYLPSEFGKKSTVHGTFMRWIKEGVFTKLIEGARKLYLNSDEEHAQNIWFAIDCSLKKAPYARWSGKNPTDRGKRGIKQAIIVDRKGEIMSIHLSAAHLHDSQLLKPTVAQFKAPNRLSILAADSAFDSVELRTFCKKRRIALIAARNPRRSFNKHTFTVSYRWIVERTFSWLSRYRSLKICWAKSQHAYLAFMQIAASIRFFRAIRFSG